MTDEEYAMDLYENGWNRTISYVSDKCEIKFVGLFLLGFKDYSSNILITFERYSDPEEGFLEHKHTIRIFLTKKHYLDYAIILSYYPSYSTLEICNPNYGQSGYYNNKEELFKSIELCRPEAFDSRKWIRDNEFFSNQVSELYKIE